MQSNAAVPMKQVLRSVAAVSGRALSRSVGLTSCGVRRTRSVVPRSTSTVCVGRPSFGGRRKVSGGSRSGAFCVAKLLQRTRCLARSARAACPSAVSARLCSAQAPRSKARCPSAAALAAKLGHSQAKRVLLPLASCKRLCLQSLGASKLTVVNASQFIRCSSAKPAPNHSVKRTAPGVPVSAAYLKR
jgi:hypothetical protein